MLRIGSRLDGPRSNKTINPREENSMSRLYEMSVEISGHRPDRVDAIKEAAGQEWPFTDWFEHEGMLTASEEGSLGGGETEEKFAERLSLAVWKANGEYCEVTVNATYLEDLPYQVHSLDQSDYERLLKTSEATPRPTRTTNE